MPRADLDDVLRWTDGIWRRLKGARIFLTGGTGFVGGWLVDSLLRADEVQGLDARLVLLTRDARRLADRRPSVVRRKNVSLVEGDVRRFRIPEGPFSHVIHAASGDRTGSGQETERVIVDGTARVLDLARTSGASRFLFVSSGAVYDGLPPRTSPIPESESPSGTESRAASPYAAGKRRAEALCLSASGLAVVVARPFSFVGPGMPADAGYAVSDFLSHAASGGGIRVRGDGTAVRSYLYASEMTAWLWTLLVEGRAGEAYNVGSMEAVTVAALAGKIGRLVTPPAAVEFGRKAAYPEERPYYVPDTRKAESELGLGRRLGLDESLRRSLGYLRP